MSNFLLAAGVYLILFLLLYFTAKFGFQFGMRNNGQNSSTITTNQVNVVKVAEGTVFALLGLLVAFSFSGAYDRFEARKIKIIEEINAIEVAYDRVDLLKPELQQPMRILIRNYVNERIETYNRLAEFRGFHKELDNTYKIQDSVWTKAIEVAKATNDSATTMLFIAAINDMFDVANTRILITRIHPPIPIFILLIGLAALSSFLVGYGMAKNKRFNHLYTLCFVLITAFTIYIIIDLEFPRMGMIRVDKFDYFLTEERDRLFSIDGVTKSVGN